MRKRIKKKKTYIAWTFSDWAQLQKNHLLIAVFRPDYISKENRKNKVRITIEEV